MPQGPGSSQETPRETPQEFFNRTGYRQGTVFDRLGPRKEGELWHLPKVPVEGARGKAEGKEPMSAREERIQQGENRRWDDDEEEGVLSEPELEGELEAFLEGSEGGGAGRRRGREDDGGPSEEAGEAEAEPPAKVPRSPPHGGGGGDGLSVTMALD